MSLCPFLGESNRLKEEQTRQKQKKGPVTSATVFFFWRNLSQRECVGASVTSAEIMRALCQVKCTRKLSARKTKERERVLSVSGSLRPFFSVCATSDLLCTSHHSQLSDQENSARFTHRQVSGH